MLAIPPVAIVILNWNGKHYLQQFLPSVTRSEYANLRVIVADNASTDDSVSFLRQNFPGVEILQLEKNFGYAKGYNEALKRIDSTYYILLNSDVEVSPGWIEPLISFMEDHPEVAACQPKILSFENRELFEYAGAAGGWIDELGYPFSRGRVFDVCEKDQQQYNTTEKIFWASGAAMAIRSEVFHASGGFDEFFFAHMEEIDLCWRLQLMQYEIYSVPASVVYHVGGGTLPRGNTRKTFLNFRNNLVMLWKNLTWSEKWWKIPFRLALDQLAAVKGLVSGDPGYFLAIVKAHFAFLRWLFSGSVINRFPKQPLKRLHGVYKGNILFPYFIKKKTRFSEIISDAELKG